MRIFVFAALLCGLVAAQTATMYPQGGPNNGPLQVSTFQPNRVTPGNVGVAFSGGGTIALSNVMGFLRAFKYLGVDTQIKAISTVSGGTWATAPYTFLPSTISDEEFLGTMVTNPGDLTLTGLFNSNPASQLDTLGAQQLGSVSTPSSFSFLSLAARAATLYAEGVPYWRLWNRMMGESLLEPFGLSGFDSNNCPLNGFCGDAANCQTLQAANPGVSFTPMRQGRPYHIMNTAMFVRTYTESTSNSFDYLAPVQSTPYMTGIIGTPAAFYTNGNAANVQVGGGGVDSFIFNSQVSSVSGNSVSYEFNNGCVFGLSDITGASSAAFAEVALNDLHNVLNVDPQFSYWPVSDPEPGAGAMTRFSDGGTLDNTGIASMLSYTDIDNIISFAYATVQISQDSDGNIILDGAYPSLFGFQQYQAGVGYLPYPAAGTSMPNAAGTEFRFNQVFDSSRFNELLQGMWAATTQNGASPAGTGPATYMMYNVAVLDNAWFGVTGGRTVNVLFNYMNPCSTWTSQLATTVQGYLLLHPNFPQLNFLATQQPATVINLLAHFASWVVNSQSSLFLAMFDPAGPQAYLAQSGSATTSGANSGAGISMVTQSVIGAVCAAVVVVAVVLAVIVAHKRRTRHMRLAETEMEDSLTTSDV